MWHLATSASMKCIKDDKGNKAMVVTGQAPVRQLSPASEAVDTARFNTCVGRIYKLWKWIGFIKDVLYIHALWTAVQLEGCSEMRTITKYPTILYRHSKYCDTDTLRYSVLLSGINNFSKITRITYFFYRIYAYKRRFHNMIVYSQSC